MLDRLRPIPRSPRPEIAAGRLVLRRTRADDAEMVRRLVVDSLAHLQPWMPWADGYGGLDRGRDAAMQYTTLAHRRWAEGSEYSYMIWSDGAILGNISMMSRIGPGGIELGYWLGSEYTGRGWATLAATALTEAALDLRGVTHVEIHHDPANWRSGAIPRRLGYRRVGARPEPRLAPGHTGTLIVWRTHAREFQDSPARGLLEQG